MEEGIWKEGGHVESVWKGGREKEGRGRRKDRLCKVDRRRRRRRGREEGRG